MAGKIIEVDTAALKSDVSDIEEQLQAIRKGAGQLEQVLHQLESMWEGNAKLAFSAAVNDDLQKLEDLTTALEKYTEQTSGIRQEYEVCESEVSQLISSIRV